MKNSLLAFVLSISVLPLLMGSCDKDYYDPYDVIYSISLPDTVYLNTPVTITGTINQPLDIRVYVRSFADENMIGIIRHGQDSIRWIPSDLEEGERYLLTIVNFETKKATGYSKTDRFNTYVKKHPQTP